MKARAYLRAVSLAFALVSSLGGCKQEGGDFCQVDDDCEAGFQCTAGTMRCQRPGSVEDVDASAPADAAIMPDAALPDAGPDAGAESDAGADAAVP